MKIGDKIIAIDECVMINECKPNLTIGKEYVIYSVSIGSFYIVNDHEGTHGFPFTQFDKYFKLPKKEATTPSHYDNTNGTIYKVQKERGWNAYVFDIVKRLERAEKKGEFLSDIDKCIKVLELYRDEQGHNFKGQFEPLNK